MATKSVKTAAWTHPRRGTLMWPGLGQRRLKPRGGQLDERGSFDPHQRGPHAARGKQPAKHGPVEGELCHVGLGDRREIAGRGTVGLVIGQKNGLAGEQPIDLAGNHNRRSGLAREATHNGHLGATAGREQRGKIRMVEHGEHLGDDLLRFARIEVGSMAGKVVARGARTRWRLEARKGLQQAMHQGSAPRHGGGRRDPAAHR